MTLYTPMPLELVLEGFSQEPEALLEIHKDGLVLQVAPVAPGVGRIVRLVAGPLDAYLKPELAPGRWVSYADAPPAAGEAPSRAGLRPIPAHANLPPTVV